MALAVPSGDADYSGITPDDVLARRRFAQMLMQQGMDASPINAGKYSPIVAIARALQGGLGGYLDRQARSDEQSASNQATKQELAYYSGKNSAATPLTTQPQSTAPVADASNPIPPGYLANLRTQESGGNDNAQASTSSAGGRYQFIPSTWTGLRKLHPELGLTPNGRFDPNQQDKAVQAFTSDNAKALTGAGIEATPANLYIAHFLGPSGATQFITAAKGSPDQPATSFVSPRVARANANVFFNSDGTPRSVGEVYQRQTMRFAPPSGNQSAASDGVTALLTNPWVGDSIKSSVLRNLDPVAREEQRLKLLKLQKDAGKPFTELGQLTADQQAGYVTPQTAQARSQRLTTMRNPSVIEGIRQKLASGQTLTPGEQTVYQDAMRGDPATRAILSLLAPEQNTSPAPLPAQTPAPTGTSGPSQNSISFLRLHANEPAVRQQFDAKFGTGAAARVLAQR